MAVNEIFAYVATSPQGTGIATVKVGDQIWLPLVAERREELEQLRPVAGQLANVLQAPVSLVKFSAPEIMGEVKPGEFAPAPPPPA